MMPPLRGPSLARVRRARERGALLAYRRRVGGMNVYTRNELGDAERWRYERTREMGHGDDGLADGWLDQIGPTTTTGTARRSPYDRARFGDSPAEEAARNRPGLRGEDEAARLEAENRRQLSDLSWLRTERGYLIERIAELEGENARLRAALAPAARETGAT